MTRPLLTLLLVLLWAVPSSAATYYVATTGTNAWPGCSQGSPCLTVDYVADRVAAGDTIRVQAGTYAEVVSPSQNGSSGSPITLIADGVATVCGIDFSGNSYIRVVGLVIDSNAGGCTARTRTINASGTNSYVEFWHNTIRDGGHGIGHAALTDRLNNSLIIGNTFTSLGVVITSACFSAVVYQGVHSVLAYNDIGTVNCDAFAINGTHNRWQNNYMHDVYVVGTPHTDFFQFGSHPLGLSYNVIEANFQQGSGDLTDEHTSVIQNYDTGRCGDDPCPTPVTDNIWRRNVWHNLGSGSTGIAYAAAGTITDNRHYHNTTADVNRLYDSTTYGHAWFNDVDDTFLYNNLEYDSWGSSVTTASVYYADATITLNYNLAYTPDRTLSFASPWTTQANPQSNVNPAFVDYANDDFTLGVSSGAIGTGGPLTVTSGSGTGTTFNVASNTGGFFVGSDAANVPQYGGALVVGDTITVGSDVLTVASVSGDAVTVTSSFTWANAEPVYFGSDTTPDIGAFPYKAGGYGLSLTHAQEGTTVTVTPSDADLVRWVVCYEDGAPVTVDAVSPFTCTVGTGVLAVRAFARYASKAGVVQATATPSAPSGLTVVGDLSLSWTHNRANVTHFTCQIGGGSAVSLGLPTPTSTTYASTLSACGSLAAGQQTVRVFACNGAACASTSVIVVKLEDN